MRKSRLNETLRRAFLPLLPLYSSAVRLRNSLYNWGLLPQQSASVPVISIGNLSVGGTGKTPLVQRTAELLVEMGHNPVILSRGYGGRENRSPVLLGKNEQADPRLVGDEAVFLATRLPRIPVVVCRDRSQAAEWASSTLRSDCFLLDDGFQHRKMQRDLDVVLIDLTNPFSNGHLLPVGRLREPLKALRRADVIVLSRVELATNAKEVGQQVQRWNPHAPVLHLRYEVGGLYSVSQGRHLNPQEMRGVRGVLFAGIGNPTYFKQTADRSGISVARFLPYRDHYQFTWRDIRNLLSSLREAKADCLITTEKDAIRLQHLPVENLPLYYLRIHPIVVEEKDYMELLRDTVQAPKRSQ